MTDAKYFSKKSRTDWPRPLAVGAAVGALCALGMALGVMESWSRRASDKLFLPRAADSRIAIVAIDDASLGRLGRWPWPRSTHAKIIDNIAAMGPKAIGYDVNFPEPSNLIDDASLAKSIKQAGNVVLPIELEVRNASDGVYFDSGKVLQPIPGIAGAAARLGHVNQQPDSDGVVRRVALETISTDRSKIQSFASQMVLVGGLEMDPSVGTDSLKRLIISYPDAPGKGFAKWFSAADIFDGSVPLESLRSAYVLVGATAPDLHDNVIAPTSNGRTMPGVEVHASILDTLLQHKFLREVPVWLTFLLLIFLGALVGAYVPYLRARWSVLVTLGFWVLWLVAAFFLFDRGWILELLWPTLALFIGFAAVVLERRIASEQQKREIRNAFSRYVSKSVVQSILDDPSKLKLGGERRRMTVLFSDVRGFTTISEGLKPERLVEVMNTYLSRMTEVVFEHGGVLDKYIGDAVMAFWNAPFDQPDHADRAVEAALDMLTTLKDMNASGKFGELNFRIGVGVNTGDMVVGNMGSEERFDYTVIGDSVNLGSRMESLTKEYGVSLLVSEATKEELKGKYLMRSVDLVAVKGKKEPVRMYEVMKRESDASPADNKLVARFGEAMQAYTSKAFEKAVSITDELLSQYPEDGPAKTLNARAKHFIQEPPPADWNGVWVMTKK